MYNIDKDFETISENFQKIKKLTPVIEKVSKACVEAMKNGAKVMFAETAVLLLILNTLQQSLLVVTK